MGRHRKQPEPVFRRGSVIALAGLVPAGVVTVSTASASELNTGEFAALSAAQHNSGAQQAQVATAAAVSEETMHLAKHPGPPVVESVALPENRAQAQVPAGPLGMPGVAYAAYQNAEHILAQEDPNCHMSWSMLAGIGQIESHQAYGKLDADGNPIEPIYGPVLDGSLYGNNVVPETDGGALDGMASYARAVGPMQFLPDTYRKYAGDARGSGISDPQNIYDASLTAGKYLCEGGLDMRDLSQQSRAIMRYNNSMAYVANVMAWETAYRTGVTPHAADLPTI
ncbi:lytic transglycosylase domain-containing protein [Nocardia jiangxiensis]|uniref:Lytic transglycosylase domain-containing protein n=1 Tax=Nocardia jiangxiensis TaxID=282685 RepID=A0ABW6RQH3_9NOCA|nr:lytic murein transglycosylase [Nocardia jiangxiensis]